MKATNSIRIAALFAGALGVSGCQGSSLPTGAQVGMSVGMGGAAITVYRPDQGKLYAYELGDKNQVRLCDSWSFTGHGGAPVPETCK